MKKNILSYAAISVLFTAFLMIGTGVVIKGSTKSNKESSSADKTLYSYGTVPQTEEHLNETSASEYQTEEQVETPSQGISEEHSEESSEAKTEAPSITETVPETGTKTSVSNDYFDDALFIGDSRTVGLMEYGSIKNATFFASTGMDIYKIYNQKINVGNRGKTDLLTLLGNNKYNKVYVMLGINELGYDSDATFRKYAELIDTIKASQPDAIIYIQANMHVSAKRSASDDVFNNDNINAFNNRISGLADNSNIFYLDVNPLFDDNNGNLRADYTNDDTHVLGKYYKIWTDWIASNAVVR